LVDGSDGMRGYLDALRASEERLRNAVAVGQLGLWDWNITTGEVHWSDEHFRMQGYAVGEVTPSYEAWRARVHPEDRAAAEAALRDSLEQHKDYVHEFRTLRPDGSVRWISARGRFFHDSGRAVRMVGAMVDVTERRESDERQRVLVAELQHRTRNLMAVVRSIADRTGEASTSFSEFREAFSDRLDALARVQGLLSRLEDTDRIAFDELIRTELAALGADRDRVALHGPPGIRLRSGTVQTLAMALHELATNAVKYGALGQPGARLAILWRLLEPAPDGRPKLLIDWRESGVRMPGAPGRGQGRDLIEKALPYQLKAQTRFVLGADGVHCTIALPVSTSPAPDAAAR
jgi:PAS domain S-box-containing protein